MTRYYYNSSVLSLLVLTSLSFLYLSNPNPLSTLGHADKPHRGIPPGLAVSENMERRQKVKPSIKKNQTEEEEELFKYVNPKKLAAALLEAINHSQVVRGREEEEHNGMEKETKTERGRVKKEEAYREATDKNRDGRHELQPLTASNGMEHEIDEEEQRRKALEEEKLTEKVTSRTTSQMIQNQTEHQHSSSDERGENGHSAAPQQGSANHDQRSSEEEEQLSPEELKSLQTMMKEFPRLNTATKRAEDLEKMPKKSSGFSRNNEILPLHRDSDLAMSKKKLKWQEETQKALHFPQFRANSIDEFENSNYGSNTVQPGPPAELEVMEDEDPDEDKVLSPEEEEARARVEQKEMMRQAEEAQRAKMEEEKLADMASDMLLRYMIKQNNGHKKYSSSLSNTAEDKRSDEEQDVTEEDDIDPETIDKLIEISSKLHLPADDVVDIITDVEKKKKNDVPPEITSYWQHPLSPLSSSFFSRWHVSTNEDKFPVFKQPFPAANLLTTWFQEKNSLVSQDFQRKLSKPLQTNHKFWSKPVKPLFVQQNRWLKSSKSVWTGYPFYPNTYSSHHKRNPFPDYYPIYFSLLSRPNPYYYIPKPAFSLNNFPGNSVDEAYTFTPKSRYRSWVRPRLKKPPTGVQQKSYFTSYSPIVYPQKFQRVHPKAHPFSKTSVMPPRQLYNSALGPEVTRNKDYYEFRKQPDSSSLDDLEKYIQQTLKKRPQMMD